MKYLKNFNQLFESLNAEIENVAHIMSSDDNAVEYLKSIDFFESHGYEEDDFIILDNIYDIIEIYKSVDDNITIHRAMKAPSVEDIDFSQTGYFWSFKRDGVGTYDAGSSNDFNNKWDSSTAKTIVLTASTHKDNISWLDTLVANAIYGEEQSECYLTKGSDITITHIDDTELKNPIKAKS